MVQNLFFSLMFFSLTLFSQERRADSFILPNHSFMIFNRHLLNPTLSVFGDRKADLLLFNRNQWYQYSSTLNTYMISYTQNNFEKSGFAVNVLQQQIGIVRNTGGVINYAKGIQVRENAVLSLGFNLQGAHSNLDWNNITIAEPDPVIDQFVSRFLGVFSLGMSLKIDQLNVGISADNLITYNNLQTDNFTAFRGKTYGGFAMYTIGIKTDNENYTDSKINFFGHVQFTEFNEFFYAAMVHYDVPNIGWLQATYSDPYGVSLGLGYYINKAIILGFNFERGVKGLITNLGPSYEFTLGYRFGETQKVITTEKKLKVL